MDRTTPVVGLLLAAGAGRRAGGPKALLRTASGISWAQAAVRVLAAGGCDPVIATTGCQGERVRAALVEEPVSTVQVVGWQDGLAASLRTGLRAVDDLGGVAALVHLVDLPDVGARVVRRVIDAGPVGPRTLRRATYQHRPGHPVLIGAGHFEELLSTLEGDHGARDHLRRHSATLVPCADLATGLDVDGPGINSCPTSPAASTANPDRRQRA